MDRNPIMQCFTVVSFAVALRKESVDRNINCVDEYITFCKVALRKESVDRNQKLQAAISGELESLSARRAWIEIQGHTEHCQP